MWMTWIYRRYLNIEFVGVLGIGLSKHQECIHGANNS